jgi:hypothetical protein
VLFSVGVGHGSMMGMTFVVVAGLLLRGINWRTWRDDQ